MTLGDNIKKYRELQGLSVQQLADKMGIGKAGIYKWEGNETKPGQESLTSLAKALDCTVNDLLAEDDSVAQGITGQHEKITRGIVYSDLIERNTDYRLLPTVILNDYKIVPNNILEGHKREIERQDSLISKYEHLINRLESEVATLRSQLSPQKI